MLTSPMVLGFCQDTQPGTPSARPEVLEGVPILAVATTAAGESPAPLHPYPQCPLKGQPPPRPSHGLSSKVARLYGNVPAQVVVTLATRCQPGRL